MDVDHVMLLISFDDHAEIEGDPPEIMHPEPLLHLFFNIPNPALIGNDKEIVEVKYDCGEDYAVILHVMEHEQSSVDT
jgi:hypothetical protein